MSNLFKISLLVIVGVLFIASSGLADTWVVAQNGDPEKDFDDLIPLLPPTLAPMILKYGKVHILMKG